MKNSWTTHTTTITNKNNQEPSLSNMIHDILQLVESDTDISNIPDDDEWDDNED